jgi:basic membrane lipoprotein Med (substrate-binding protein (PBP1-ABC) superfamily)
VERGDVGLPQRHRPQVMGILNTTPDSFSDSGQFDTLSAAKTHAKMMINHGADIIDITFGGFGRGSGNAISEYTLAHMENKGGYSLLPALIYADKWVESYKKSGIPYLLSGIKSMHVNYAIEVIEKHENLTMQQVWDVFNKIIEMEKHHFYSSEILTQYM